MSAEFIELTEYEGRKFLLNTAHVLRVRPDDDGAYLYFDVAIGRGDSLSLSCVHVAESYSSIKRLLLQ